MQKGTKTLSASYKELLLTYLGPQRRRVVIMSVLLLIGTGFQLANPYILRYFIDAALSRGGINTLLLAGALFMGIAILKQAATIFETYISENVAWTATNRLRADLISHVMELDMAFHKERTVGELIERIDGDVETLSTFFSRTFVQIGSGVLLIVGIVIISFTQHWLLGLIMGTFSILATYLLMKQRNFAERFWITERQRNAEFYGYLSEQIVGTADIRANGATGYVMHKFYELLCRWYPASRNASLATTAMFITTILVFGVGNAAAFAAGAYLMSNHAISTGTVYFIFYCTNLLNMPIEQVRRELVNLQKAGAGIQRIRELFAIRPTIQDGEGIPLSKEALSVEFRNVTFSYNGEEDVLCNVSFHLEAGKVLGVLGRTGGGKTTLTRLILRLYDIQEGEIHLGRVPLRATKMSDLRKSICMVTQDVQLFHASVRDNLTFFDSSVPDERILQVIEDIGLGSWLRSLSQGLDTELGSDDEGLSAGEAQLLAFTRAFLKDPGLVILDEASSRIDPATEQLIEHAISKLLEGRTGIIIAHRLGTVQRADEILVLDKGSILEYGKREELANNPDSRFYNLLQTGLEEVIA